jgi:hypothetical protein
MENIDNYDVLAGSISLQNPNGLHYYYLFNSTAQLIVANLLEKGNDNTKTACLGVINHCCRAELQPSVREKIMTAIKANYKSKNVSLRNSIADCPFKECAPVLMEMTDDTSATVRRTVYMTLSLLRVDAAKARAAQQLRTEKNKQVVEAIKQYLKTIDQ